MRRDKLYLADMVEACDDIAEFVREHNVESFTENKAVRGAVLQKLIVIGEAAARLSPELKSRWREIEWAEIAGLRNRVVHGYFSVEWPIIWVAATEEVPALRQQVARILDTDKDL